MRTVSTILPAVLAALSACAPVDDGMNRPSADPRAAAEPNLVRASADVANYAPPDWPLKPGDRVTSEEWDGLIGRFYGGFGSSFHAVVWVVSESGAAGAIPFGAWWSMESGLLPGSPKYRGPSQNPCPPEAFEDDVEVVLQEVVNGRLTSEEGGHRYPRGWLLCEAQYALPEEHFLYLGHYPAKAHMYRDDPDHLELFEEGLPPSLRGIIDPWDHALSSEWLARRRSFASKTEYLLAERARYYGPGAAW